MMAAARSCWSDLSPELLGLVLKHLPSLADRVWLRAVCHPWRSNARLQSLPPPLPLLALLDGTFLSIPDGEIIKLPVPEDACCYGSIDNWLFLVHSDGKCLLMEPFSGDILKLPNLNTGWYLRMRHGYHEFNPWYLWMQSGCYEFNPQDLWIQRGYNEFNPVMCKLSAPSPLESSLFPLVAMMHDESLSIFKPPIVADTLQQREPLEPLIDVSFFEGKLYAVNGLERLLSIELVEGLGHRLKISSYKCIIGSSCSHLSILPESDGGRLLFHYLVECAGRLLMLRRWICASQPEPCVGSDRTCAFEVFEADLSSKPCQWRRVDDLGGHALFVSSSCSKSFPAGECSGVQENCIYFMSQVSRLKRMADPLHDSGVYNMKNGAISPLLSKTAAVPSDRVGRWHPTWLFPTQAM